ncbi:MAG: M20/M25/M40 family metallo-hydrolase [Gemmatimonadetes bacterium]|nr:M20/M25/M40 family metallo-hydrolase [Gemmatimonadota bacterium]
MRTLLRALGALGGVGLILLGVAVARTLALKTPEAVTAPAMTVEAPSADTLAQHLAQAVRFGTVSWSDTLPPNVPALDSLHQWMVKTFPRVHATLKVEKIEESWLYTWEGSDSRAAPVLLMAHLDVVPVEKGSEGTWKHPPFSGDIAEGYVWGRGTLDDKVNAVAELEAIEGLLAKGLTPKRTVLLAFGHNEEVLGSGARAIAKALEQRGVRLDLVIDEGGALADSVFPGLAKPTAVVGIAEKGYQSIELIVKGAGGHSSQPPDETAAGVLAAAVARVQAAQLPSRFTGPTEAMLDGMAPHMGFGLKLAMHNRWLFGPVLTAQLLKSPASAAMLRTTTAPTMLSGSPKDNVLPLTARAVINFRILPGETRETVKQHVVEAVHDDRVQVAFTGIGSDPSPVSDVTSEEYDALQRTIREITPAAVVVPYLVIGGTDSRHYSALSRNVFRFSPTHVSASDLKRAHGTDERVAVNNLPDLVRFYSRLVQNVAINIK